MGLEFKMGSEILRTVVVREWKEIGIVAGIIALRAALTFLLHWEIKEEEKSGGHEELLSFPLFIIPLSIFMCAPINPQNTGTKGGYYF